MGRGGTSAVAAASRLVLFWTAAPASGLGNDNASAAHSRFINTQTIAVCVNPSHGTSTKALVSTPNTAPSVFAAYRAPIA